MVVSVLLKIKFGHTQTSVPKIGIYIASLSKQPVSTLSFIVYIIGFI